jgi:hypothetical protein
MLRWKGKVPLTVNFKLLVRRTLQIYKKITVPKYFPYLSERHFSLKSKKQIKIFTKKDNILKFLNLFFPKS